MDKTHDFAEVVAMSVSVNRLNILQSLLRSPLQASEFKTQVFPQRYLTPDEVIVTHRFIIVRAGAIDYTVEGVTRRLAAGTQLFVPAWSRREWRVTRKTGDCALLWCAFSSGAVSLPATLCWRHLNGMPLRTEVAAFEGMRKTMIAVAATTSDRTSSLLMEGELKAALARFWTGAQSDEVGSARKNSVHREVARAISWLERHYARPDALNVFYHTLEVSPNHFRVLFKRDTGETVQGMLARLRLRRARYLVQETSLPMKQIAAETGYPDPLYFSNQYRKFWERSATADRLSGGGTAP